jgi:hypothetical protein
VKARHAARVWWNKRRPPTPIRVNAPGFKRKDSKRSQSPDVPDEHHDPGDARLEMLVNSALELPAETRDGVRLRQRSAANPDGATTPNEIVVEMGELDKVSDDIASAIILRLTVPLYYCPRHSRRTPGFGRRRSLRFQPRKAVLGSQSQCLPQLVRSLTLTRLVIVRRTRSCSVRAISTGITNCSFPSLAHHQAYPPHHIPPALNLTLDRDRQRASAVRDRILA